MKKRKKGKKTITHTCLAKPAKFSKRGGHIFKDIQDTPQNHPPLHLADPGKDDSAWASDRKETSRGKVDRRENHTQRKESEGKQRETRTQG